ncbi:hypothetical protein [Lyngbya confervoides]|uniref:Uncharacterized protein n=1 Tax=Lyngbya confervoides BDU141951 TaxID=1574623 RepID=A0ABD4T5P7_9CYAN|nr:hypothetical protein [Lyngbya confervoides]MCM1983857.1 hypothetical protein [Lyngbya confervoides BDU141951]
MKHPIRACGAFLTVASLSGATAIAMMAPQVAKAETPRYTYSAQMVERYNSGCREKLQVRGYTEAQAIKLCQCSLTQMQMQHSQTAAIVILTGAQLNPIKDPQLGLPTTLSKYFTPCFG